MSRQHTDIEWCGEAQSMAPSGRSIPLIAQQADADFETSAVENPMRERNCLPHPTDGTNAIAQWR